MNEDYIENTSPIGLIRNEINTNQKFADLFKSRQEARREVRDLKLKLSKQAAARDTNPNQSSMVSAKNLAGWTSFGYPMLNSETELRPYIIQDAKGAEWTINSKGFYNKDIKVRVKINGKEEYITADTNYANTDWMSATIPSVEKYFMESFSKKYGIKKIQMFGMNIRATSDAEPTDRVYNDDKLPNNDISGIGLVYNIRLKITWNDETEVFADTALVFHNFYMASHACALFGAASIPYDILSSEYEGKIIIRAAEQRIKKLHTAKTL